MKIFDDQLIEWALCYLDAKEDQYGICRRGHYKDMMAEAIADQFANEVARALDDRSGRWKGSVKTECGIHTKKKK